MPRREPKAFLHDISVACARIDEFTHGIDFERYRGDALIRSAVERQFEIIGETLNRLSQSDPDRPNESRAPRGSSRSGTG